MNPQYENKRTGTQSIEKVVMMLRIVASRGRSGMRIQELTDISGLPQSTCFRMLQRLELEGLVARDAHTRKYYLGPLLHELGLIARPRFHLSQLCDGALHQLADVTQDTVYLSERSGLEAVCTNRALGDYPIKSLALDVGIRRPLGVGAGGLAILCALPEAECEAVIQANSHHYEKYASFSPDFLRQTVAESKRRGYAFLESAVTPGAAAIGLAFPANCPVAAISVAAISSRLEPARCEEIAQAMRKQITTLTNELNAASFGKESARRPHN
ncbi:IclR family transcriptional regulator [Lampropedia aestuarii]|uniref:IclR family transcriptional regulator n=1 Tax=Lampropedia aestuarii TaxID=2562762 RepID=A0A4S5BUY3_9BURK|nr:IclR family transcriptional regulator [Lampropedia aestuarii]THJ33666.1 IclR family transcriptional regulator [Lampropedia aestuarii]